MEQVIAGDDITIEITVVDEQGNAIDISLLKEMTIDICRGDCSAGGDLNYAISPTGDELPIDIIDAPNGIVEIVVSRDFTAKNVGYIYNADLTAIFDRSTSPEYKDGEEHRSVFFKDFVKIKRQC